MKKWLAIVGITLLAACGPKALAPGDAVWTCPQGSASPCGK